jgi:acetolactate synthase small subunit
MIGRVGTIFGKHGINISSAAVGHTPDGASSRRTPATGADEGEQAEHPAQRLAAMVVTTDVLVPADVVREIVALDGFVGGWAVVLR